MATAKNLERLIHVIVLSNFARGFDKYALAYCKAGIPESSYPDRFHLLTRDDLVVGVDKAQHLLDRLAIPGDRLLALETVVSTAHLSPNKTTGLGMVFRDARIQLSAIYDLDRVGDKLVLRPTTVEDAMAASLAMHGSALRRYTDVRPRAISFLPIASACQARCSFCFSSASISVDQDASKIDWDKVSIWLRRAHLVGAERAVITGGGEPTLLPADQLQRLVVECSKYFGKTVLITNVHILAMGDDVDREARLEALSAAGLSVLAISRHHEDDSANEKLMGLPTPMDLLVRNWSEQRSRWPLTADLGVEEICFKELYASTSTESVYFDRAANTWSRDHQVSLSM